MNWAFRTRQYSLTWSWVGDLINFSNVAYRVLFQSKSGRQQCLATCLPDALLFKCIHILGGYFLQDREHFWSALCTFFDGQWPGRIEFAALSFFLARGFPYCQGLTLSCVVLWTHLKQLCYNFSTHNMQKDIVMCEVTLYRSTSWTIWCCCSGIVHHLERCFASMKIDGRIFFSCWGTSIALPSFDITVWSQLLAVDFKNTKRGYANLSAKDTIQTQTNNYGWHLAPECQLCNWAGR